MAVLGVPLINGVAYAHADILVEILGVPIIGVTAIDYSDPQEITANHATGHLPVSVGFGAVTPQATITLTMEEVQNITEAAPSGRIQNIIFFDIGINYIPEGGIFVRHRLKRCRFKGRNPNSQQGGSQIEEALELFVADIDYKAQ